MVPDGGWVSTERVRTDFDRFRYFDRLSVLHVLHVLHVLQLYILPKCGTIAWPTHGAKQTLAGG